MVEALVVEVSAVEASVESMEVATDVEVVKVEHERDTTVDVSMEVATPPWTEGQGASVMRGVSEGAARDEPASVAGGGRVAGETGWEGTGWVSIYLARHSSIDARSQNP